ncbi:receptor-type tyrosine-protein phosphatase F-like isoform X2 [Poecilia formosa]|uniref:receptor-type tyrosine-protein phosphatase F-like isoform X2 n=1 Tax=Poecilia formosa TaxID=48698 RepID=UPI0007BA0EF8|nr:PREDICTED: receptor-type tyrosine-protein phosphatase F-like isoform X2 [Poecilia formosa]
MKSRCKFKLEDSPASPGSIQSPPHLLSTYRHRTMPSLCQSRIVLPFIRTFSRGGTRSPAMLNRPPPHLHLHGLGSPCLQPSRTSTTRALQIENSDESDQGKYECVAVNSAGTRFSSPANLYVRDQREVRRVPPRFSIPPTNCEVMPAGSVNLTCVAVGSPMPLVKWMSDEVELTQEDELPIGRSILQLTNIKQSANYTCVAISTLGMIETTAQVFVKALPKMPTFLQVVETTATSVTLTWKSGNAEPVSYYLVQYRSKTSGNGFQEIDGVASSRYSIGGLNPFSDYEFRVLASNSVGRGPPSSIVKIRTGEQAPSSPPLHVRARLLSSTTILVEWEPPEEPNGQLQGYRIFYSSEPSNPLSTWQIHNTNDSKFTSISELTPNITYSLRMLGFTSMGDGPLSDVLQLKTQQRVPHKPSGFEAEAELDTRIMLYWLWPVQDHIISYELSYWEANSPTNKHHVSLSAAGSFAVDGLKPDTLYLFSIAARSERGLGVFTQPIQARTTKSMLGPPPRKVVIETLNSTTIKMTWKAPLSVKQYGQIQGYHVVCSKLKNGEPHGQPVVSDISNPNAQEAFVSGLLPETTYSITLVAYTAKGDGASSKAAVFSTNGAVPGKPSMMISTMMGNTAMIQWQPPKEMMGEHLGYQLQYKRADEKTFNVKDFRKTDDHFTLTHLLKGATYIFKLSTKNQAGTGEEYIKEISTPEDMPSSYPQNLRVAGLTSTSTALVWEPPPLSERNGKIIKYVVVYRDINSKHNNTNMTTETRMTILDLQPDTTYDIRVQAFTNKGGGPFSPSIQSRTTSSSVPVFVKNFGVKAVTKTSVLLSWEVPVTNKYQIQLKILYNNQKVEIQSDLKKKLITRLQPDTYYSFVLMSYGNGAGDLQQQVSVRTAPNLLSVKPTRYQPSVDEAWVTIVMPEVPVEAHVRWFYIVVVPETLVSLERWENPEDIDIYEILEADSDNTGQTQSQDFLQPFIVAKMAVLPEIFMLADEKKYNGFYNRPLPILQQFRCFVLADLKDLESRTFVASPFSDTFVVNVSEVTRQAQEDPEMLWVVGPVLAVIIIIITVISILLFKSKQERKHASSAMDEHILERKDSLMTCITEPVEMRLKCQILGMTDFPPIPVCDLADHIERHKANDSLLFSQEFQTIDPGQQLTWEHSNLEINRSKNRYANVIAYDHSRVVLTLVDGIPGSNYINANYIDGYRKQNAYIATQGPLPETICDFWRMVWEQRSCTIVMMTRLEEKSRVKCDQYWPSRGTETYGTIQVTILETLELATYVTRIFSLYKNESSEKREVQQLQFLAWPDHGVPEQPTTAMAFLHRARAYNSPDAGPMVVHCSAGVGRTGCFIAIDAMLERMKYEKSVDIYGYVTCMRAQRNYMVQTEDQYIFIHEALLEAATCGKTEVPARSLYTHLQKLIQIVPGENVTAMEQEFKRLTLNGSLKTSTQRCISAKLPWNTFKNRLANIMPFEFNRVCLQPIRAIEGSDYINASFIDGYRHQKAYIAAQGPLAQTTEDLWRMLWEHNSTIVIMLTKLREMGQEKCHQYWPVARSTRYQYLVVDPVAQYNMPQYILREFKVTDARDGQSRTIRQFQYTHWPEQGVPKTGEDFINFIGQVHKTKEQFGQDGPITVHCSAGVGRTGVFITLSIVLERMRYEGVVDIFQTVKILQTQRPAMVQTKEQYHMCYKAALEYLGSFDIYGMQPVL